MLLDVPVYNGRLFTCSRDAEVTSDGVVVDPVLTVLRTCSIRPSELLFLLPESLVSIRCTTALMITGILAIRRCVCAVCCAGGTGLCSDVSGIDEVFVEALFSLRRSTQLLQTPS